MGQPWPLFLIIFGLFKQTIQFLHKNNVKKCPSSILYRDLNPQPLEHECPSITTRSGRFFNFLKQLGHFLFHHLVTLLALLDFRLL